MNVISSLPRWAQGPIETFVEQKSLPGTRSEPLDHDSFEASFKTATGAVMMAAQDEIPGEDDALGQPGVVRRNGATVYVEGDSSNSGGAVEAAVVGRRRGVGYVTYVQAHANGFTTLQMVNDGGDIEVTGSLVQRNAQGIDGFLIAGSFHEASPT